MIVARNAEVEHRAVTSIEGLPPRGEVRMKPLMTGDRMIMLEVQYPAGAGSPLHADQHESLCYIVKGKVRMVVGEETYTLEAGDVCRHPDGVPHGIEALDDATVLEIKSPAQPLEQFLGTSQ